MEGLHSAERHNLKQARSMVHNGSPQPRHIWYNWCIWTYLLLRAHFAMGRLFNFLDNSMPWLLLVDLNMTEFASDQWGGNPKNLAGRELQAFSHLKQRMKWEDTFQAIPGRLGYLWDNKRKFTQPLAVLNQGDRILKHIDRIYAPLPSAWMCFKVASKVIPGYSYSNHLPILADASQLVSRSFCLLTD
jgi:hypothetical protein